MSHLLRRPAQAQGQIHQISAASAGWDYVGFDLHRLVSGDRVSERTENSELLLVLVEGHAGVEAGGEDFGLLGTRNSVFETGTDGKKIKPHAVYVPRNNHFVVTAADDCTLAVCRAPAAADLPAKLVDRDAMQAETRGIGSNTRFIHPIAMEDNPIASSLLVTEVFTPDGNWSSYPPHRHDEDDFPNMTYLEETYYHRLNPAQGFGIQRVFTEDGSLDETIAVHDHDVVLVPKGHHPCGSPYGFEMYYLNVMAGPLRKWRFKNHPDFDWIAQRDAKN